MLNNNQVKLNSILPSQVISLLGADTPLAFDTILHSVLNIQDTNITLIDKETTKYIKNRHDKVLYGRLTYTPRACERCRFINTGQIIRKGWKHNCMVQLLMSKQGIWLNLSKQIFQCHDCGDKFLATSPLVNKNAYISNTIKYDIAFDLMNTKTETQIATDHNVSVNTVSRAMDNHNAKPATDFSRLPRALMFDEVNLKNGRKLSFIAADAKTHKPISIEPFRNQNQLRSFFLMFSRQVRKHVRTIVVDMNTPYFTLIKELFPHARIIIDRFHIVKLTRDALRNTRVQVMKSYSRYGEEAKARRFMRNHKWLLEKDSEEITYERRYYRNLGWLTEQDIIDRMLHMDPTGGLKGAYDLYQDVLYAVHHKDANYLQAMIDYGRPRSSYAVTDRKTLRKLKEYLSASITSRYSNGPLEALNGRIKLLKRISYGLRNWTRFRNRIFMVLNKPVAK